MTTATSKGKQARWKCPTCDDGVLAPQRMRKDDVRRFCLPCSSDNGRLVPRVAPALERKRQVKTEKQRAAAKRKRATAAKKRDAKRPVVEAKKQWSTYGFEGFHVKKEAERLWRLLEPYHRGAPMPRIETSWRKVHVEVWDDGRIVKASSKRRTGVAYRQRRLILLEPNVTWHTLAHELVHMAVGFRYANGRREVHDEVFYKCLKDLCERRWKIQVSFYKVPPWGYAVDRFMEAQMRDIVKFTKKTKAEVNA